MSGISLTPGSIVMVSSGDGEKTATGDRMVSRRRVSSAGCRRRAYTRTVRLRGEAVDLVEDPSSVRLMSRSVGSMGQVMGGVGHTVIQVPGNLSRVESHLGDLEASLHRRV